MRTGRRRLSTTRRPSGAVTLLPLVHPRQLWDSSAAAGFRATLPRPPGPCPQRDRPEQPAWTGRPVYPSTSWSTPSCRAATRQPEPDRGHPDRHLRRAERFLLHPRLSAGLHRRTRDGRPAPRAVRAPAGSLAQLLQRAPHGRAGQPPDQRRVHRARVGDRAISPPPSRRCSPSSAR